jgi:hypothetical protein
MIAAYCIEWDFKEMVMDLWRYYLELTLRESRKPRKPCVRIAGVTTEIRTWHLMKVSPES